MLQPENDDNIRFDIDGAIDALEEEERRYYAPLEPKNRVASVCKHWLRGLCRRNMYTCEYYHIYDEELLPLCQFFTRMQCNVPNCMFRHPLYKEDMVYCVAYARGFCPLGPKCLKRHDKQPASQVCNIGKHVRNAVESNERARKRKPDYLTGDSESSGEQQQQTKARRRVEEQDRQNRERRHMQYESQRNRQLLSHYTSAAVATTTHSRS